MGEHAQDRVDPILDFIRGLDTDRELAVKAVVIRLRRSAHHVDTEVRRRLGPRGMEMWELELLATVLRHACAPTIGQLQDSAQLTSGAITHRITRLEEAGYLVRQIDPDDRRQVRVALTPAGEQRARDLIVANDEVEQELFGHLDPALVRRIADDLRSFLLQVEGPTREQDS